MRSSPIPRLLVLLLAFAAGCASNNTGKLEGTSWRSEVGKVKGKQIPEGFLKIKFAKDGSMEYHAGHLTFRGTYTLGMGNQVTFHLDKPLAGRTTHTETVEVRLGQLIMTDSDGTEMNFRKN